MFYLVSVKWIGGQEKIEKKEFLLVSICTSSGEASKVGKKSSWTGTGGWKERFMGERDWGEGVHLDCKGSCLAA